MKEFLWIVRWLLPSTAWQTTPQPSVFKQFSVFTVLWRLAQLGESCPGVLSCDRNQGSAGLESSESLTGLQVRESHVWHFSWDGWRSWRLARHLSSASPSVRLSWISSSSWPDGLRVDFWPDSRLPPGWVSQGRWGKWKSFFWPAAEVTQYHLWLMLVSQKPVTDEPICTGRGIAIERQGSLGTSLALPQYVTRQVIFARLRYLLAVAPKFLLLFFVVLFVFWGRLSRIRLHHHLLHRKR